MIVMFFTTLALIGISAAHAEHLPTSALPHINNKPTSHALHSYTLSYVRSEAVVVANALTTFRYEPFS